MHIKFHNYQRGFVHGVLFEGITVISATRYALGIDLLGQLRGDKELQLGEPGVSVDSVIWKNIIVYSAPAAGLFLCGAGKPSCTNISMVNVNMAACKAGCMLVGVQGSSTDVEPASCNLKKQYS